MFSEPTCQPQYGLRHIRPRIEPSFGDHEVIGTLTMDRNRFIRCLGPSTWDLWYRMLCRRSKQGVLGDSISYLAKLPGFPKLSPKQTKRSLRRLECAGLVKRTERWQKIKPGRSVRTRLVYGYVPGTEAVLVPPHCLRMIENLPKNGGKRQGSGRIRRALMEETRRALNLDLVLFRNGFSLREREGGEAPRVSKLPQTQTGEGSSMSLKFIEDPAVGTWMSGAGRGYTRPLPGQDGVPPYPGFSRVQPAMVPNPPQLDPALAEPARAQALAGSYRGAVDATYGGRSMILRSGDVTKSKPYKKLLAAAEVMLEHEIAPAAWAAWSVDYWKHYMDERAAKKPPPITWVWCAKRIEEKAGWFHSESERYNGGRVIFGPSHRELTRRYTQMTYALHGCAARGEPFAATVQRFFPDGLYDRLVDAARKEGVDEQQRLRKRVKEGAWIW